MKKQFFSVILLFWVGIAYTQTIKYRVEFTDKNGVEFNPYTYFSEKAIQRRLKNNIPLVTESDKPVKQDYYNALCNIADSITGTSRWFNAVTCWLNDEAFQEVQSWNFVKRVVSVTGRNILAESRQLNQTERSLLEAQTQILGGNKIDSLYTGKGIRICVIDAGFSGVEDSPLFRHIRENNRIVATWDFKKNKENVYKYSTHGTGVLSCIAGIYKGKKIGLATEAEFLLARTERTTYEGEAEEEDWLEAVEWADKNGADIINSSLGYTNASHFVEDMDGKTTIITKAANIAASKGILVVTAMGNEGDGRWKYLAAPADADSALSVGGINPWTGLHTSFSSYGPNASHQLKPNVSAFAHAIGYSKYGTLKELVGTSFASPLIAGFAACMWQADTTLSNMELFHKIEQSANLYPYYDYAVGYGIPKASNFLEEKETLEPTFYIDTSDNDLLKITINEKYFSENNTVTSLRYKKRSLFYHLTDNYSTASSSVLKNEPNVFYFHVENNKGILEFYEVIAVNQKEVLTLFYRQYQGKKIRFHYKRYTQTIQL